MNVEYPSGSPVSISKRMYGFKLKMAYRHLQQGIEWKLFIIVHEIHQIFQLCFNNFFTPWGRINRLAGVRATSSLTNKRLRKWWPDAFVGFSKCSANIHKIVNIEVTSAFQIFMPFPQCLSVSEYFFRRTLDLFLLLLTVSLIKLIIRGKNVFYGTGCFGLL